jgi:hypothetical protein
LALYIPSLFTYSDITAEKYTYLKKGGQMKITINFDKTSGLTFHCQLNPTILRTLIAVAVGAGLVSIPWIVELLKALGLL